MIQNKCKNCSRFRRFYYKGKRSLMEAGFGTCVKQVGKLKEFKNSCELFEEKKGGRFNSASSKQYS